MSARTKRPTGRSSYDPATKRVADPNPQGDPDLFSAEDILAEIKYLLHLNMAEPDRDNTLRTIAYAKLLRYLSDHNLVPEGSR